MIHSRTHRQINGEAQRSGHTRRGAALLIVLGALIITTTSALVLAQAASSAHVQHRQIADIQLLDDLLVGAESLALDWLREESASTVLPPDVTEPLIHIADDLITIDDRSVHVRMAAWDQQGMPPLAMLRPGSSLRSALPDVLLALIDRVAASDVIDGVDRWIPIVRSGETASGGIRAFPLTNADSRPIEFGDAPQNSRSAQAQYRSSQLSSRPTTAIGAHIATHGHERIQPARRDTNDTPAPSATINVNTAPQSLLEPALRSAGRSGLDLVMQARAEGKTAALGELSVDQQASSGRRRTRTHTVHLTARSSCWAVRIDISTESATRSWWCVYQRGSRNRWTCVQRLLVTEAGK